MEFLTIIDYYFIIVFWLFYVLFPFVIFLLISFTFAGLEFIAQNRIYLPAGGVQVRLDIELVQEIIWRIYLLRDGICRYGECRVVSLLEGIFFQSALHT